MSLTDAVPLPELIPNEDHGNEMQEKKKVIGQVLGRGREFKFR
jgi:hypothetical protein